MPRFFSATLPSPFGEIAVAVNAEGALAAIVFTDCEALESHLGPDVLLTSDAERTAAVCGELRAYFASQLQIFTVPLAPILGTPFQRRVWTALQHIPCGETWSYARLAQEAGSAARAVGAANAANPIAIIVPCHRVIGADGSLTGYSGGLERKRRLLAHEGVLFA